MGDRAQEHGHSPGWNPEPNGLRTGKNSGYQAINLAVHLGAAQDCPARVRHAAGPKGEQRWFGAHPMADATDGLRWAVPWSPLFDTLVEPLAHAGMTIVNATRRTALDCFPKVPLVRALRAESPREAAGAANGAP
jgi:hypothetical protein